LKLGNLTLLSTPKITSSKNYLFLFYLRTSQKSIDFRAVRIFKDSDQLFDSKKKVENSPIRDVVNRWLVYVCNPLAAVRILVEAEQCLELIFIDIHSSFFCAVSFLSRG